MFTRLTPARRNLITQAKQMYRQRTPLSSAVNRLQVLVGDDRSELLKASDGVKWHRDDPAEYKAVTLVLQAAAQPERFWPQPATPEEEHLANLSHEEAFQLLAEMEPRLIPMAHSYKEVRLVSPLNVLGEDFDREKRMSDLRLRQTIFEGVRPLVGPEADTNTPLLKTVTAMYAVGHYLYGIAGVEVQDQFGWWPSSR